MRRSRRTTIGHGTNNPPNVPQPAFRHHHDSNLKHQALARRANRPNVFLTDATERRSCRGRLVVALLRSIGQPTKNPKQDIVRKWKSLTRFNASSIANYTPTQEKPVCEGGCWLGRKSAPTGDFRDVACRFDGGSSRGGSRGKEGSIEIQERESRGIQP